MSHSDPPVPGRCPRCFLSEASCLCAEVRPQHNRMHVAVVRHSQERKKSSNSARLAALVLSRMSIHDHGVRSGPLDQSTLVDPGHTWLLYPDGDEPPASFEPPRRVIVLDGSWPQARRMVQRLAVLRGLPRVRLRARGLDRPRLRTPPQPGTMSTIEAIAAALALCGEPEAAAELERVYDLAVERAQVITRRGLHSVLGGKPACDPRD